MSDIVYQASDLTGKKRVEFINEAHHDRARLRSPDGTSLVMLRESKLDLLEALAKWGEAHVKLSTLLRRSTGALTATALGELAWLRSFDRDDLEEFLCELQDAIIAARADEDTAVLDECIQAWRATARQLADPLRRSVLLGPHLSEDFVEAGKPSDGE
ncbi:hypothetical protein GCM10009555_081400 [Acrocarpospora macrocephala]|uniref:Uncharacterized protein n=1 Tax=Acrocarpospora macrocephala TaxID=150177 RepID=A0A5M3WS38_9ACTN|nr:hypothetical protein [Acrocarpospora macrocephala]GES10972.1 hypothetical protein Amac_045690 [Acrocarpospora macrocephala]